MHTNTNQHLKSLHLQLILTLLSSTFYWCMMSYAYTGARTPTCPLMHTTTPNFPMSQISLSLSWRRHSYFCMLKLHQWWVVSFKWPFNKQQLNPEEKLLLSLSLSKTQLHSWGNDFLLNATGLYLSFSRTASLWLERQVTEGLKRHVSNQLTEAGSRPQLVLGKVFLRTTAYSSN